MLVDWETFVPKSLVAIRDEEAPPYSDRIFVRYPRSYPSTHGITQVGLWEKFNFLAGWMEYSVLAQVGSGEIWLSQEKSWLDRGQPHRYKGVVDEHNVEMFCQFLTHMNFFHLPDEYERLGRIIDAEYDSILMARQENKVKFISSDAASFFPSWVIVDIFTSHLLAEADWLEEREGKYLSTSWDEIRWKEGEGPFADIDD